MAGVSLKSGFLVAFALIFSLLIFNISGSAYTPSISFGLPVKDPATGSLGVFLSNDSLNVNFNLTFDYPFPAGEGETNMTAEIWDGGRLVQSETVPLRPYLEKYGITKDGKYVLKPIFFNIFAEVTGRNVSSTPIQLGYTVNQYRRRAYLGEGDNSWMVWGRIITGGAGASLTSRYCSGPWDFEDGTQAYDCMAGGSNPPPDGGGGCQGPTCIDSTCCLPWQTCCESSGMSACCDVSQACCQTYSGAPQCCNSWQYCDSYYGCMGSFTASTQILTPSGSKPISSIRAGDDVFSFSDGNVVSAKVLSATPAHRSQGYFTLRTADREVNVTGNHQFYTPDGFRKVSDIYPGDEVFALSGDALSPEKITYKGVVSVAVDVYDFEVEGTHAYFANGFAVHNDNPIDIQRGSYTSSTGTKKTLQKGPVLYFLAGTNDKIPTTPAGSGVMSYSAGWQASYSWKFETFVYPTRDKSGTFKIYADNGARVIITNMGTNGQQSMTCLVANPLSTITPCTMQYAFSKETWYRIQVFLFNNPGGDSTSNPAGIRIEDADSPGASILNLIGEDAVMNSESPGADNVQISGSETIYAGGQEGLFDIRDFSYFSTDHAGVTCDSPDVSCSLRMACGNSDYEGLKMNKYGWKLNHRIYPETWDTVGGISTVREWSLTTDGKKGGPKIDFDRSSIETIAGRSQYTTSQYGAGNAKPIGGIYRCKDDWPYWEMECQNANDRYSYSEGSKTYKCCYVAPTITPHSSVNYGGVVAQKDFTIRIDYNSYYTYIINFLPPYGNVGDKLCAIPKVTIYENYPIKALYNATYNNQLCNQNTTISCCYCRPGWGCRLDCKNELNRAASERFTLPFPASYGQLWSLKDVSLAVTGTSNSINLTTNGNISEGWILRANLLESANLSLDKNYTIPLSLSSDFGLETPSRAGVYVLTLRVHHRNETVRVQSPDYVFYVSECVRDGEKRSFYDEAAYLGTKNTGICRPGVQVCRKIGENDYRWRYETSADMPVYPTSSREVCNGIDDDCNGIVDDIGGFDAIMRQIIDSAGRKTPYDVTRCGCFMGAQPRDEKCNNIDDDCDGVVDNADARVWANTCDSAVEACMDQGSPYEWCKKLYNSSACGLTQVPVGPAGNATVNSCTEKARACMGNRYVTYIGDTPSIGREFTYDDCKGIYNNYTCVLSTKRIALLGDTCRCTTASPTQEACNGVDDNCNGLIDDVPNATTCACAMVSNITLLRQLKAGGDASCNGIDSDCNGAIDDGARSCACSSKRPSEVLSIKLGANESCNGIDDDCDGLIDEKFPYLGRPCGYGVCAGGSYTCTARGDNTVCNTTVGPEEALNGRALKMSSRETCDLKDNNCDGSIDEGCSCTPENTAKLCGYQSGIYYKNMRQLDQTCASLMEQLSRLLASGGVVSNASIYEKCTIMLSNVTYLGNETASTLLSLCDSVRICNKTNFPINPLSECTFGTQTCTGGKWANCSAVLPVPESCNGVDDDCNGVVDDVPVPSSCACYNGTHAPGTIRESCNGVDDDCDGIIDDVNGGSNVNSAHCGCFGQTVNITQKRSEIEITCNSVDDNCNGIIDENVEYCACNGTLFGPGNDTVSSAITAEKCNGRDDNCNGVIDEPWLQGGRSASGSQYLGAICGPLNSRCSGGIYVCSRGGSEIVCSTSSNEGVIGQNLSVGESCNGIDDNCNGVIDDLWGNSSGAFCQCYNGVPPAGETCDGRDNNCNAFVDDGVLGCGCSFGLEANVTNMNQLSALIIAKKSMAEVCNNMDDNCNNQTDEGLGGRCFCGGGFLGNPAVRPEFCNGVDDDCDGTVDNVANPRTCACVNQTHAQGEIRETCNSVDDNCNGFIDENWKSLGGTCGIGACTGGVYECSSDGTGELCSTGQGGSQIKYRAEICGDGIDNDCDGAIDEGCACDAVGVTKNCSINVGECRMGVQTCMVGGWSGCIGGIQPQPEVCDGKDNDCDGVIDNVPNPSSCACSNGGTAATESCNGVDDDCNGVVDDVGGKTSVETARCGCYDNKFAKGARVETCNNIDDDCNGVIDDIKGGNSAASTRCACYGGVTPGSEKCNGVDDDCNGLIDETWPDIGKACGQGICAGLTVCSADGNGVECNGVQPQPEICDGKDNDCDGVMDEGCFGSEITSCENGVQDGDEAGVDCGGSCPSACQNAPPSVPAGSWMIVLAALIVVIVAVGLIFFFVKPAKPV